MPRRLTCAIVRAQIHLLLNAWSCGRCHSRNTLIGDRVGIRHPSAWFAAAAAAGSNGRSLSSTAQTKSCATCRVMMVSRIGCQENIMEASNLIAVTSATARHMAGHLKWDRRDARTQVAPCKAGATLQGLGRQRVVLA